MAWFAVHLIRPAATFSPSDAEKELFFRLRTRHSRCRYPLSARNDQSDACNESLYSRNGMERADNDPLYSRNGIDLARNGPLHSRNGMERMRNEPLYARNDLEHACNGSKFGGAKRIDWAASAC